VLLVYLPVMHAPCQPVATGARVRNLAQSKAIHAVEGERQGTRAHVPHARQWAACPFLGTRLWADGGWGEGERDRARRRTPRGRAGTTVSYGRRRTSPSC